MKEDGEAVDDLEFAQFYFGLGGVGDRFEIGDLKKRRAPFGDAGRTTQKVVEQIDVVLVGS